MVERTLVLIKPDAMANRYFEPILRRFQNDGFRVVLLRVVKPTVEAGLVESHYKKVFLEHPEYRESVVEYITSGVLTAMILEREDGIQRARQLIGPLTNAPAGTIRGDFRKDQTDPLHTLVHASDSLEAAQNEIRIWFAGWEMLSSEIGISGVTRRDFIGSALLLGLSFVTMGKEVFAETKSMSTREQRELLFAQAVASQKNKDFDKARQYAKQCLDLLKDVKSLQESATTVVSLQVDGQEVLVPGLLHTDTALFLFRAVGIEI